MTNVKVHLKEITKYVLLLGTGLQAVLGIISGALWISHSGTLAEGMKSVLGLAALGIISYLFLSLWCKGWPRRMHVLGTMGIVATPVVLQVGLEAGRDLLFFIGSGILAIFVLALGDKCSRMRSFVISALGALVAMLVLCNVGTGAPSFAARVASRCCYPELYSGVSNTPQELQDKTGYLELRESLRTADGIYTILYPSLLERHGSEAEADAVCYELAAYGLGNNTRAVAVDVLWDIAGYHFPMPVSELQMQGMGYDSVTGHNYGALLEKNGGYASLYWKYSVMWSVLATLLALVAGIGGRTFSGKGRIFVVLLLETGVLCYVMHGGGMFDYKNLPLAELIRMGFVLEGLGAVIKKDE